MKIYRLIFAALVIIFAFPTLAEEDIDLAETYVFDSGATFSYPEGWSIDEEPTYVLVSKEPNLILFVDFEPFDAQNVAPDSNLADEMKTSFGILYGNRLSFDEEKVESIEIDDREAIRYAYTDDQGRNGLLIFIRFSDGTFGMALASDSTGKVDEALSLSIISTFDSNEDIATEESVTTGQCRVSTPDEDTVQLHVGPGTNRAVYDFMPANQDFEVLGQAEARDGSLWWKLDKDEVTPRSAASEAWVAKEAVTTKGNCDDVTVVLITPTPSR